MFQKSIISKELSIDKFFNQLNFGLYLTKPHYLITLFRKPHALINSCTFKQIDINIQYIYKSYFIGKEKEFIELLNLVGEVGIEKVKKSLTYGQLLVILFNKFHNIFILQLLWNLTFELNEFLLNLSINK